MEAEECKGEDEEDDDNGDVVVKADAVPGGDEEHLENNQHSQDYLHRQSLNLVRIHLNNIYLSICITTVSYYQPPKRIISPLSLRR